MSYGLYRNGRHWPAWTKEQLDKMCPPKKEKSPWKR